MEKFDIEDRWPELFAQLDPAQRNAVLQSLASAWHAGWIPNREDVENLTDEARGAIDEAEYLRRAREAARRAAAVGSAPETMVTVGYSRTSGNMPSGGAT